MRKLSDQVKMSTKEYLLIAFGLLLALLLGVAAVFTKNYILPWYR